jgi:type IV pilus assembly protein PilM
VEKAGFNPVVVDVDAFALGNQFELNHPDDAGETIALIDVGASVMKTNVVRRGESIFARDVSFGGSQFTQAIADRLNTTFEQAERAKLGKPTDIRPDAIVPALEAASRQLSLEVRRTFDYFGSMSDLGRIGRVVMSGGAARLPGLTESLSTTWSIPVEVARPLERIDVDPALVDQARAAGPALAIAVGLALRNPGDRRE